MGKMLSGLTALVGIVLAVTPWALRFTTDRAAFGDVVIGGLVVAVLGALTYGSLPAGGGIAGARH